MSVSLVLFPPPLGDAGASSHGSGELAGPETRYLMGTGKGTTCFHRFCYNVLKVE